MLGTFIIAFAMSLSGGETPPLKPPVEDYSLGTRIYTIPFQAATFVPSTIETIENAGCIIDLSPDAPQIRDLRSLIFRAEFGVDGDFDYRMVRMKVVGMTLGPLYIDRYGQIIGTTGWIIGQLNSDDLAEITRYITDLANQRCEMYWGD